MPIGRDVFLRPSDHFLTTKNAFIAKIFANSQIAFEMHSQDENSKCTTMMAKIISLARLCVIEEYRKRTSVVLKVQYDTHSNLEYFRITCIFTCPAVTGSHTKPTGCKISILIEIHFCSNIGVFSRQKSF